MAHICMQRKWESIDSGTCTKEKLSYLGSTFSAGDILLRSCWLLLTSLMGYTFRILSLWPEDSSPLTVLIRGV